MQLISTSLQAPSGNSYWASMQDVRKMTSDTTLFKIYLGLVFIEAQNENIVLYCKNNKEIRLDSLMNTTHLVIASYMSYFRGFAQKAQVLDEQIASLNKTGKRLVAARKLLPYRFIIRRSDEICSYDRKPAFFEKR